MLVLAAAEAGRHTVAGAGGGAGGGHGRRTPLPRDGGPGAPASNHPGNQRAQETQGEWRGGVRCCLIGFGGSKRGGTATPLKPLQIQINTLGQFNSSCCSLFSIA